MGAWKEIVARGTYFIEIGASDLDSWSELMIDDLGVNVKPILNEIRQWSLMVAQRKSGSQLMKINCWDFRKCGKEANGKHVKELGICPVYLYTEFDGIHGGQSGGRACWIIREAKCGGIIKRVFVPHFISCITCDFRRIVLNEEGSNCIVSDKFLNMLIH